MKKTTTILLFMALFSVVSSCKKDLFEILFPKNKSFVECMINRKKLLEKG